MIKSNDFDALRDLIAELYPTASPLTIAEPPSG
jgi:hypothetical protein